MKSQDKVSAVQRMHQMQFFVLIVPVALKVLRRKLRWRKRRSSKYKHYPELDIIYRGDDNG